MIIKIQRFKFIYLFINHIDLLIRKCFIVTHTLVLFPKSLNSVTRFFVTQSETFLKPNQPKQNFMTKKKGH